MPEPKKKTLQDLQIELAKIQREIAREEAADPDIQIRRLREEVAMLKAEMMALKDEVARLRVNLPTPPWTSPATQPAQWPGHDPRLAPAPWC